MLEALILVVEIVVILPIRRTLVYLMPYFIVIALSVGIRLTLAYIVRKLVLLNGKILILILFEIAVF